MPPANTKQSSSSSSSYGFLKALSKSFKKSSTGSKYNSSKVPFLVDAKAVGGSAEQPKLIEELKNATNHRKLEIILSLKESIKTHSISSILETWIPARQILSSIEDNSTTYTNYEKLREAVIELLYTCIQYDDLSQLSVVTRYFCDILYFCQNSKTEVDPNLGSFLNCFYLLVDNKLVSNFHNLCLYLSRDAMTDNQSLISADSSLINKNIELMTQKFLAQFIMDILCCEVLLTTPQGVKILTEFINKLNTMLLQDNMKIFDSDLLALVLNQMFRIALTSHQFDNSHLLITQIFSFINVSLGHEFIPISVLDQVVSLLCFYYDLSSKYSTIIEAMFRSLIKSDNCCLITFTSLCSLIESSSLEEVLGTSNDAEPQVPPPSSETFDNEIITYRDAFVSTISELSDDYSNSRYSSNRYDSQKVSALERFLPMLVKTQKKLPCELIDSVSFNKRVLSGALNLIVSYISYDNFQIVMSSKPEFIFDTSSFKFQSLVNAMYKKLNSLKGESDLGYILATCKSIVDFIEFLFGEPRVFRRIPDDLLFYNLSANFNSSSENLNCNDTSSFSDSDLIDSSYSLDIGDLSALAPNQIDCFSLFDVLDSLYDLIFEKDIEYDVLFKNLYKDDRSFIKLLQSTEKFSTDELLFANVVILFKRIIDKLQKYGDSLEYESKLEAGDVTNFVLRKWKLLSNQNWQSLMNRFKLCDYVLVENNSYFVELMNMIVFGDAKFMKNTKLFTKYHGLKFKELKLSMLKTMKSIDDHNFNPKGNNEKLWPLVLCLFGVCRYGSTLDPDSPRSTIFSNFDEDDTVIDFSIDLLRQVLIVSKKQYFKTILYDYILHDIMKSNQTEDAMSPSGVSLIPAVTLLKLSKLLVEIFAKTCIQFEIKDHAEKAELSYECLVHILRYLSNIFKAKNDSNSYMIEGEGEELFNSFFVVSDCMSRLRASEEGKIYFDKTIRAYNLLTEEQSQRFQSTTQSIDEFRVYIDRICAANEKHSMVKYLDDEIFIRKSRRLSITNSINEYFQLSLDNLQKGLKLELVVFIWYNMVLQLSNVPLFKYSSDQVRELRSLVCDQLTMKTYNGQLINRDLKVVLQKTIIRLASRVVIHSKVFRREHSDNIVKSLVYCLENFAKMGVLCIHTLTVCCYQIPGSIKKFVTNILFKLQQHLSNMDAAPHILEFLLSLSHMSSMISDFNNDEFKLVFGIAFRYIQTFTENDEEKSSSAVVDNGYKAGGKTPNMNKEVMALYLSRLSYNVITSWFLKMKMKARKQLAPYLIKRLVDLSTEATSNAIDTSTTSSNSGVAQEENKLDPRCLVLIDFVQRFTYSNLDLRFSLVKEKFDENDTTQKLSRWVYGLSIISVLTHKVSGESIITIRRPSGTTKFRLEPHQSIVPMENYSKYFSSNLINSDSDGLFTEGFIFLQLMAHIYTNSTTIPLLIPDTNQFKSLVHQFDNLPLVEIYKAGIIYIAPGQEKEEEFLMNTVGSKSYQYFLKNIGELIRLKGCENFYVGGLDTKNDEDGEYAYCWDGKTSQLIFHTTTLMPAKNSQSFNRKKSHVGNNYVNIFFDESGIPFEFGKIKSEFKFINIVITPVSLKSGDYISPYTDADVYGEDETSGDYDYYEDEKETYFSVKTYLRSDLPQVFSTCKIKTISSKNLPVFIRNLALIAYQFADIWGRHYNGGANWLHRYDELMRIKQRVETYYAKKLEEEDKSSLKSGNSNNRNGFEESADMQEKQRLFNLMNFTHYS